MKRLLSILSQVCVVILHFLTIGILLTSCDVPYCAAQPYESIAGRVTNEDGTPLQGILVSTHMEENLCRPQ